MLKNFLKNETGDTNIVSILIILAVVLVLVFLFKGYVIDLITSVFQ